MRTRIAVGLVAAVAAGMALVPMSAKAFCIQTIYAERALAATNTAELRGRTSSTDTTMWISTTPVDSVFTPLIFSAVSQRNRVMVTAGTETSACPAAGVSRNMGTISALEISP
jgi:hypothetical protein